MAAVATVGTTGAKMKRGSVDDIAVHKSAYIHIYYAVLCVVVLYEGMRSALFIDTQNNKCIGDTHGCDDRPTAKRVAILG